MNGFLCQTLFNLSSTLKNKHFTCVFGGFSQIFKTNFLVQTLMSKRNLKLIESFRYQNLSSLKTENTLNLKNQQFSFHVVLHRTASLFYSPSATHSG